MIKRIDDKNAEMTILADKLDELTEEHAMDTTLNALLSVLTWKIVDASEMSKTPVDEIIDNMAKGLKEAAQQILELVDTDEDVRSAKDDRETLQ